MKAIYICGVFLGYVFRDGGQAIRGIKSMKEVVPGKRHYTYSWPPR